MNVGSLFSGIGGIELGIGGTTVWHSEIDRHAAAVLRNHWPDVPNLGDITAIDWANVQPVDVIVGGFPCQDISLAGNQAGIIEGTRSGLWSYYVRAVRHLRPAHVLVENVSALLSLGMGRVLGDLAEVGYDTEWASIRASDIGAPHRRERIFIHAWPAANARLDLSPDGQRVGWHQAVRATAPDHIGDGYPAPADTDGSGGETCQQYGQRGRPRRLESVDCRGASPADTVSVDAERRGEPSHMASTGRPVETETRERERCGDAVGDSGRHHMPPRCDWGPYRAAIERWEPIIGRCVPNPTDNRGRLNSAFVEWMMGFPECWVDGLTRTAALKCLGNAVVPQCAALAWHQLVSHQVPA